MRPTLWAALLLFTITAHAGERGNGGDVIICRNNNGSIKSAELYDHFEGRARDGRILDLGAPTLSVEEKVSLVLDRFARVDLKRATLYRGWFKTFFDETKFISGIELQDVPDTGDGLIPAGCELKQLVVQMNDPLRPNLHYTVSKDYWDLLDNDGKAGTILHEIILREFVSPVYRQQNSRVARFFNALLSSTEGESLSVYDYVLYCYRGGLISRDLPVKVLPWGDGGTLIGGRFRWWQPISVELDGQQQDLLPFSIPGVLNNFTASLHYFFANKAPAFVEDASSQKVQVIDDGNWNVRFSKSDLCLSQDEDNVTAIGLLGDPAKPVSLQHETLGTYTCSGHDSEAFKYPETTVTCHRLLKTPLTKLFCEGDSRELKLGLGLLRTSVNAPIDTNQYNIFFSFLTPAGRISTTNTASALIFPTQSFEVYQTQVQLTGQLTGDLLNFTITREAKVKHRNGRVLLAPATSVLTVTPEGLVETCTTYNGKRCW